MSTLRKENSTVRFAKGTRNVAGPRAGPLTHMYRPELHRQVTERMPASRLGHELTRLCQTGLGEPCDVAALAQARLELSELMDRISLSLKRNRVGLDVLSPVMLHCFTHWQVTLDTTVVCLVPVTFPKAKVVQKDIAHVLIKLPPDPDSTTTATFTTTSTNSALKSGVGGGVGGDTGTGAVASSSCSQVGSGATHKTSRDPAPPLSSSSSSLFVADVRTRDGLHVSPPKLHAALSKLVRSSLLKHGVSEDRIHFSTKVAPARGTELTMFVTLDCGWRAELVPCVAVKSPTANGNGGGRGGKGGRRRVSTKADVDAGVYYVSRPFPAEACYHHHHHCKDHHRDAEKDRYCNSRVDGDGDSDSYSFNYGYGMDSVSSTANIVGRGRGRERGGGRGGGGGGGDSSSLGGGSRTAAAGFAEDSDISWRPCFAAREQEVLQSISSTDSGLRLKATYLTCRLLARDWRLQHFTCYDVQTVLLHDMDFQVDFSPRWQRCQLETCVLSLLRTLLDFVERGTLPHFDVNQLDLWRHKTRRQMELARGALSRLLSNDNALISLVRRASDTRALRHSVDFGLLGY